MVTQDSSNAFDFDYDTLASNECGDVVVTLQRPYDAAQELNNALQELANDATNYEESWCGAVTLQMIKRFSK